MFPQELRGCSLSEAQNKNEPLSLETDISNCCFLSIQGDTSVVVLSFYVLVFKIFVLLAPYVCFHIFS